MDILKRVRGCIKVLMPPRCVQEKDGDADESANPSASEQDAMPVHENVTEDPRRLKASLETLSKSIKCASTSLTKAYDRYKHSVSVAKPYPVRGAPLLRQQILSLPPKHPLLLHPKGAHSIRWVQQILCEVRLITRPGQVRAQERAVSSKFHILDGIVGGSAARAMQRNWHSSIIVGEDERTATSTGKDLVESWTMLLNKMDSAVVNHARLQFAKWVGRRRRAVSCNAAIAPELASFTKIQTTYSHRTNATMGAAIVRHTQYHEAPIDLAYPLLGTGLCDPRRCIRLTDQVEQILRHVEHCRHNKCKRFKESRVAVRQGADRVSCRTVNNVDIL